MYTLVRWSSVITLPIAVGVGGIALVLLVVADTWAGRALGLGFFCASVVTALLPLALDPSVEPLLFTEEEAAELNRRRSHLRRRRVGVLSPLLFVAAICLGGAWVTAPAGVDRTTLGPDPGLQSIWIGPGAPNHLGLPWVTPERDQLVLATHLLWAADPFLDRQEAGVFRAAVRTVYDELGKAPGYGSSGSALGLAYAELLGGSDVSGHIYVDMAPGTAPQPAILFVHGWGGNGMSYLWSLRRSAHEHGYAVVGPSYGAGLWYQPEAGPTIDRTLEWMASTGRFDMDHIVLAGLSNGGYGVLAAAERWPWRGVAWLSAVMFEDVAEGLATRLPVPMLVLHGGADDRIPMPFIEAAVAGLRANGASVDLDVVEDADHFLLFTHRDRVDQALDRWLSAVDAQAGR